MATFKRINENIFKLAAEGDDYRFPPGKTPSTGDEFRLQHTLDTVAARAKQQKDNKVSKEQILKTIKLLYKQVESL
jgi:hypothetical protein